MRCVNHSVKFDEIVEDYCSWRANDFNSRGNPISSFNEENRKLIIYASNLRHFETSIDKIILNGIVEGMDFWQSARILKGLINKAYSKYSEEYVSNCL